MQEILNNITSDEDMFTMFMVFGMGGVIALFAIFFGSILSSEKTKQREKTKREIAAYVAEGSMTPDEGERLIKAGLNAEDAE
jgi:hypothetical protein